jgi:hypothetical protein
MLPAVGRRHADGMPAIREPRVGWTLTDLLDDRVFERSGDELADQGLFVALPPWGCHLLAVR